MSSFSMDVSIGGIEEQKLAPKRRGKFKIAYELHTLEKSTLKSLPTKQQPRTFWVEKRRHVYNLQFRSLNRVWQKHRIQNDSHSLGTLTQLYGMIIYC